MVTCISSLETLDEGLWCHVLAKRQLGMSSEQVRSDDFLADTNRQPPKHQGLSSQYTCGEPYPPPVNQVLKQPKLFESISLSYTLPALARLQAVHLYGNTNLAKISHVLFGYM